MRNIRNLSIDAVDRLIIDQLRIDGRQSFAAIGNKVGLSEPTVRTRYNRLTRLGILAVVGVVNPIKVNEIEFHIFLKIVGRSVWKVAEEICDIPEATYVAQCVGEFDLVIDLRCTNDVHVQSTLEMIRNISGVVAIESFETNEIVKETYLWEGLLSN